MAELQTSFEPVLASLAQDPVFRDFARPGSALLLWDLEGGRLLWASPAAAGLRDALAQDEEGRISPSLPARVQLRALGQGLAPSSGARLERLRFDRSRLTPPVTCACRRVTLPSGGGALLTAVVGALPKLPPAGAAKSRPAPEAVDPARIQRLGTVRFLWRTDAAGRFTYRSEALADVVGRGGAAILGRTLSAIVGELVLDPFGVVSGLFSRPRTWSGQTVLWRIAGTDSAVPVDLAGTPVFDADQEFLGFRGFGLCRPEGMSEWAPTPGSVGPLPSQPTAPPRAQAIWGRGAGQSGVVQSLSVPWEPRSNEPRSLPHLSAEERTAFREIARALGARFEGDEERPDTTKPTAKVVSVYGRQPPHPQLSTIIDSLPVALLVHHGGTPLFANRSLLDLIGYSDVQALGMEGGMARLFPGRWPLSCSEDDASPLVLVTANHESHPVEVRSATLQWEGQPATALVLQKVPENNPMQRLRALELDLRASEARIRELTSILDTATDGVIVLDDVGRILSLNRSAEALFGYDQKEIAGENVTVLLAPESHGIALDYLDGLRSSGVSRLLNDGREVLGRVRQGGAIPLSMSAGRTSDVPERRFCVVLRDITALKKAEAELFAAKHSAEDLNAKRSDFLGKISHELRTPLNAIIGFAELMLEERFGAVGNERYKDYLKDIQESARGVMHVVSDLLDLARIEAGCLELSFTGVNLNDIVASSVSTLIQNATRERIVVRTSFAPNLPSVVADERSLRQSISNIVSNAVKFTRAGGQVIVSTTTTDRGEVVLRVRDTGIGMSDHEMEAALQPLRQLATARKGGGTGLGLPLARALVEANRGVLHITSAPHEGTLVEIIFPPTRVLVG